MSILVNLLLNNGYIIVNKEIIKKFGLHEAIILGELCSEYSYWEKSNKLDNGYFYSTRENIEKNTGLSAYQQREPFKNLIQKGVILEKLKGMPQQKWYSINMDKLYSLLNEETELTSSCKKIKGQDIKKLDSKELRNFTSSRKEIKEHNVKKLDINNNNNNNKKNNNKETIWFKNLKEQFGENFEELYANYKTTNN